ncbi:hypothetical protein [Streptomyces sp. SID5910]|uniref:hypothetical protein n=1 Tax=Streptomyces sp. SID5910 TaxID=2690312 RepID=UPI00136CF7E7|nr:hypothetical protein [Streptomyces sp. SID5910]MYR40641.1 hypothetical protein [Streptomyces sp. SID5910]
MAKQPVTRLREFRRTTMRHVSAETVIDRRSPVERWLLSAAPAPGQTRRDWARQGVALLPLGVLFSAVRIPGRLVQAVAGSASAQGVDDFLDEALDGGPVICDPRGPRYYALVPANVPATWRQAVDDWRRSADVDCLGRDTYLGVPRIDRTGFDPHTFAGYWAVAISSPGRLCPPLTVARLIAAGVHLLPDEREEWPACAPLR